MTQNLYEILGVSKGATDSDIKRAYRKLAQKYHPDRNKGNKDSEQKFKEVNTAYETLSDPKKRQMYDQFGNSGSQFSGYPDFDYSNNFGYSTSGGFDYPDFGGGFADIFETFFGAGRKSGRGGGGGEERKKGPSRGEDLETGINITFEESLFGCQKEIKLQRIITCENCEGSGAEKGSKIVTCQTCKGAGEISKVTSTILGQMITRRICGSCEGEGKTPEHKCQTCHGRTRVRKTETITIKIPAGVPNLASIRVPKKGNAGEKSGYPGDLYVTTQIQESKEFERDESDLKTTIKIHATKATLGGEIEIETPYGPLTLKIPAGTQPEKIFRIKNYGVKKLHRDERGDLLVKIKIEIPQKISKEEMELYKNLDEIQRKEKGFFGKLFD